MHRGWGALGPCYLFLLHNLLHYLLIEWWLFFFFFN